MAGAHDPVAALYRVPGIRAVGETIGALLFLYVVIFYVWKGTPLWGPLVRNTESRYL